MWSAILKSFTFGPKPYDRYFSTTSIRLEVTKAPAEKQWKGGIRYHGFTYYPRPGQVDPVIKNPARLFMVQRIKPLVREPYWVKDIIKELKLDGDEVDKAIVINTPEINAKLWTAKHIIKVIPITFPYGMPKEGDMGYLNDDGQYILTQKIKAGIDEKRLEASHKFFKDPTRIEADTIKKKLREKWLRGRN